jgi:hypothetical protein
MAQDPRKRTAGAAGTSDPIDLTCSLQKQFDDLARLHLETNRAVADLLSGKNDDLDATLSVMQRADRAFKELIAECNSARHADVERGDMPA